MNKFMSAICMKAYTWNGNKALKRLEKDSYNPMKANEKLLMKMIKRNKNTEYGKLHHFSEIHSIEDFRKNVPVSTYADFSDYIERTKLGENGLLTKSPVVGYARTSGSSGAPKFIPATKEIISTYIDYTATRILGIGAIAAKLDGVPYKPGRCLFTDQATKNKLPDGRICSNIVEVASTKVAFAFPWVLTVPCPRNFSEKDGDYCYEMFRFALEDEKCSFIVSVFFSMMVAQFEYLKNNWQVIVDDIEKGVISDSVNLVPEVRKELNQYVKPMPERAAYLRKQFEQGFDSTIFKRLWPNMYVISGIGTADFAPAAEYIRGFADGIHIDYCNYASSEGLMAACWEPENPNMQFILNSCFYEFIPEEDDGKTVLTLDQIELGKRYEMVITSWNGLYRYRLKDIVEVTGFRNACPTVIFKYRRGQLLNIAGEKFSEEDAQTTVGKFEKAHNIKIDHWILYQDSTATPNCYCFLLECKDGTDLTGYSDEFELIMGECNERYPWIRGKGNIGHLKIRMQKIGTHDAWVERCVEGGASAYQVKPVHVLDNDNKKDFFLSRMQ